MIFAFPTAILSEYTADSHIYFFFQLQAAEPASLGVNVVQTEQNTKSTMPVKQRSRDISELQIMWIFGTVSLIKVLFSSTSEAPKQPPHL